MREQSHLEQTIGDEKDFKKILVVDDILYVVKSISRILVAEGYFVFTARTGKEALDKFVKYSPDLITLDQKLPDMTGLQLVQKIRKLEKGDHTIIIFISSVYEKEEITSILQSNISDYLLKPFKKAKLIDTVQNLIGRPGLEVDSGNL